MNAPAIQPALRICKAGVHAEMPAADYHADPCETPSLSSSIARLILTQSPLHAWTAHPRLNPKFVPTEKGDFDLGAAAHAALLEDGIGLEIIDPENYPTRTGTTPKGYTTDAMRYARDSAHAGGKVPVLPHQFAEIERMVVIAKQAIADCKDLGGLTLADGTAEQVVLWQEHGGVWCRARPDWMSHDRSVQISYKSTAAKANPEDWVRTGLGIGFDMQEVFYARGNAATGGPEDGAYLTLVQENYAPYACAWIGMDPSFVALATEKVEEAIALWRRCLLADEWPAYPMRIHWVQAPSYEQHRWEERGTLATWGNTKFLSAADRAGGVPL